VAATAGRLAGDEAGERIAVAYAQRLHQLMAYKDEYEVARLHLDSVERARVEHEFGADADVSILLHPPALRALGMKRKIRMRRTAPAVLKTLHALRGVRGTRMDVFGYAKVRREERALIAEYSRLVRDALPHLTSENVRQVEDLVQLAEAVRGYEDIKLDRISKFRENARQALARLNESAGVST
jgi:indolepyruvate ferredoxin oxidoreductase